MERRSLMHMSDSPLDSIGVKDVTKITGPTLAGSILNWYLYGVLTVQYVLYLMYSRNDKTVIKIIVHFIFILDTIQTFLTMDDLFFWFVYNFGDLSKVDQFHWAFDIPSLDAAIASVVQLVYCWRIWVLSGWRILPIASAFVALLAGASGITIGIQFQRRDVPGSNSQVPIMLWLFGSAVVDVVVASTMTYILLRVKKESRRAQPSTGGKILRLLTLTLETNAITTAVAIETVIVFFIKSTAPPTTNFYQIGGYLLGKLYSNCFMILLNQRHQNSSSPGTGSTLGSRQYGSRTDNIELGTRSPGISTFVGTTGDGHPMFGPSTPSKTKEFPGRSEYQSNVSFKVPGIDISKTVITT